MNHTNYKKNRPALSEEQILKNKDFNKTLKQVKPKGNAYLKSFKYWGTAGVASIILIASIFLFNDNTNIQSDTPDGEFTYQPADRLNQLTSVKPPFMEYDIKYEIFEVDCSKDEEITTKSGTTFNISKNSLTDENGILITGIAQIHYRELRNPVDFFLSGIPMDYDSAGTTYTFESAGMLDIKAFQNETPLQLSVGKTIDFRFNSTTSDDGYSFYSLDEQSGVWSIENQNIKAIKPPNKLSQNKKEISLNQSQEALELIPPVKQSKMKYSLDLKVNKENYPELDQYEGTIFEINESEEKFDPIIYKIQWQGATLSDSKIKDNYTLQLTREDSSISLTVYPVVKDEFYLQAINQYHQEKSEYQALANNYEDDFEAYNDHSGMTLGTEVRSSIIREFSIAGFGIYNCDTPRMQPQLMAKKTILNTDSVQLKFNQYFVANTTRNSVVTLGTYEQDSKVKYYKKSPTVAWFVNDNGMISVINSEQFKNIKNYKHLTAESFSPNQGIEILRELMAYK